MSAHEPGRVELQGRLLDWVEGRDTRPGPPPRVGPPQERARVAVSFRSPPDPDELRALARLGVESAEESWAVYAECTREQLLALCQLDVVVRIDSVGSGFLR
jgi:hypothetical protein